MKTALCCELLCSLEGNGVETGHPPSQVWEDLEFQSLRPSFKATLLHLSLPYFQTQSSRWIFLSPCTSPELIDPFSFLRMEISLLCFLFPLYLNMIRAA